MNGKQAKWLRQMAKVEGYKKRSLYRTYKNLSHRDKYLFKIAAFKHLMEKFAKVNPLATDK